MAAPWSSIDPVFLTALARPHDRCFLLKVEKEVIRFLHDPSKGSLCFPPTTSYHRMLLHHVADRFRMDHLAMLNQEGARVLVMIKRLDSCSPVPSLLEFVQATDSQAAPPPLAPLNQMRIMKRRDDPIKGKNSLVQREFLDNQEEEEKRPISLVEKEQEYRRARAIIFNKDEESALEEEIEEDSSHSPDEADFPVDDDLHEFVRYPLSRSSEPSPNPESQSFLEVYNLPPNLRNYEIDVLLDDLKLAGASIEFLSSGRLMAIFPTPSHAEEALLSIQNSDYKLRRWQDSLE